MTYFLEVVVNVMMVPGRIENWIILIDLDYKGMIGLQISVYIKMYIFLGLKTSDVLFIKQLQIKIV